MQDLQDQRESNDSLREQLEKTKQESAEKGSVSLSLPIPTRAISLLDRHGLLTLNRPNSSKKSKLYVAKTNSSLQRGTT